MNDEPPSTPASDDTPIGRWWRRVTQSFTHAPATREELMEVLIEARDAELMDADALTMFQGVLQTADTQVGDIMVPRSQMVVIEADLPMETLLRLVVESGHSRYPVIGDSRDEVIGVLLAKDLLQYAAIIPDLGPGELSLRDILRPAVFVPESKRVNVLLKDFKRGRNHMAIVADEYGGVAGLVTIEDVLEQIVGEIDDEHDEAEGATILRQDERRFLVNALTPIEDFNEYFECRLPDDDFDTIGGLVVHHFGHMPRRGETLQLAGFNFNVQRADSRRLHLLQVMRSAG
ncbi:MAG: transporter associated domain-containing protein [Polycyclovorans sp.]|jgi:magnesium and cobalt transporter|nr:magnesium/cobalt efflux protein [Polycyclovorans sp.]MBU0789762.1 CBS domain-containing protein [Gammaproteobacteria bacterium]MDP1542983.1 transporter associated domain-containing protein [Polycyclovorans sp.]MEC8849692.1 transporter associated domain-containing protein [Pseudomonadota bacterium]|tara:strand:- start:25509 stop:26375 length:867 start_codon:yes stop_codon:yes gene_type:complete